MNSHKILVITFSSLLGMAILSGCANTIRGLGKDASNTVDATKNAVKKTGDAIVN